MPILHRNSEKLSLRLLFWILFLSSILALIATTIQLYTDYRDSRNSLDSSLNKIEETALPAIAVAMWKLDKEVMDSLVQGMLSQSGITHVEIDDTYGYPVSKMGNKEVDNRFERTYPIKFTTETDEQVQIGQLKVTATLSEIYQQLFDKGVIILLTQGLKTFFMSICILILVDRLVIRHLNDLALWANEVDLKNPNQSLDLHRKKAHEGDVLDKVQNAINTMQSNLLHALAEQKQTERLIQAIIENSPSLIYAKDLEGRYIMMNQKYLNTLELSLNQVLGRTAQDIFSDDTATKLREHDLVIVEKREPTIFEEVVKPKGEINHYISAKFPIFDELGNLVGTGGVSTNITDRKAKEQQIIELNESLESKVQERTTELELSLANLKATQEQLIEAEKMAALGNVVTGVAHEINTPLGVSFTATSHLKEIFANFEKEYKNDQLQRSSVEGLIDTTQESVKILEFNLKRAISLIQNFKLIAVDQGSDFHRELELKAYLEEIVHSLSPELKKGAHTVTVHAENLIQLNTYPGALVQIFTNLIMNSILHGFRDKQNGEIQIRLSTKSNVVLIDYQDDGKGLDQKQREKVFEPFYTTQRGTGGSGLGMSICYNLVTQKLNGKISSVESAGGAHFKLRFPISEK